MPNLITLKDLPLKGDNSTVYIVGKVDESSQWVSKNEKKTRTFKMIVSDEYGSTPVLTFNDKIDLNKSLNNDYLPDAEDIVIVKGTKKQDCIFAESFGVQTLKIYTKTLQLMTMLMRLFQRE